jgi:predicted Zn-dependent protease
MIKVLLSITLAAVIGGAVIYDKMHPVKHKLTDARIYEMYNRLESMSGQPEDSVPLFIVDSPEVNAWCDGLKIVLYRGLIDKVENEDELALVLAHELAHKYLRHIENDSAFVIIKELQADKYGAILMMRAGYDVCAGRNIMLVFMEKYGDSVLMDHPSSIFRYNQLNVQCGRI